MPVIDCSILLFDIWCCVLGVVVASHER